MLGGKLALVAWLLVFVATAWVVEEVVGIDEPLTLHPLLALILAGVPAGLWLAFFYFHDRHEPEPKAYVAGVFALGALVAAPLADFITYQLSPPQSLSQHGIAAFSADRVVYAFLVVGMVQELCKYVVVRYTVYMSGEFDEPMDGVVYMMACGTGFAVWLNYHRLSEQGHQVYLSKAAAQAVVTTLAHASFAGVLGYVMGRAKFSRRPPLVRVALLMLGLLSAALLNGLFSRVENWVVTSGLAQHPWRGVGLAALFAAAVFGVIWFAAYKLLEGSSYRRTT